MARIRTIKLETLPNQNTASSFRCCLYVIQEGDDGPVKVGMADHPYRRLSTHQTGNPRPLALRAVYEGERGDCRALEKAFFLAFGHQHIRGEWYSVGADLAIAFLKNFVDEE